MPAPVPARVIVYSTPWCGHCHRLTRQLDREGIDFVEVDIEQRPAAADVVMQVNDGLRTVPTVVFPDGTVLSNPSVAQVLTHLAARVT